MPDTDLATAQKATLSLLVVDDDQDIRDLMADYLRQHGFQVRSADGGDAMFACIEEEKPDLILMDIRMPEMNGLDATRIIKEINHNTPVIALSAYAFEENIQEAKAAGCDEFLAKPFRVEDLIDLVRRYLKD